MSAGELMQLNKEIRQLEALRADIETTIEVRHRHHHHIIFAASAS
jgi:hypothetical protein